MLNESGTRSRGSGRKRKFAFNTPIQMPIDASSRFFFPPLRATTISVFVLKGLAALRLFPRGHLVTKKFTLTSRPRPYHSLETVRSKPHPHPSPHQRRVLTSFWGAPFHLACIPPIQTKERNTKRHQNEISPPAVLVLLVIQRRTFSPLRLRNASNTKPTRTQRKVSLPLISTHAFAHSHSRSGIRREVRRTPSCI